MIFALFVIYTWIVRLYLNGVRRNVEAIQFNIKEYYFGMLVSYIKFILQ